MNPVELVTTLVPDVMNGGGFERLQDPCDAPLAPKLRAAFEQFAAFPDGRHELVETLTHGNTVAARMRCTGRQSGTWQGLPTTGRSMRVDENLVLPDHRRTHQQRLGPRRY
jgi:hypothetical protein